MHLLQGIKIRISTIKPHKARGKIGADNSCIIKKFVMDSRRHKPVQETEEREMMIPQLRLVSKRNRHFTLKCKN
ncbi:CLUMA_CG015668, isoform A [Clunio marinus]|uniref:CLUMA_CG015668, isoform A n=1 Tax=Clunio marinus TaxID=568069 RepID=A0A1J1IQM0_9DIPT|nr:CLUMA_CG015668, isoform A [Clunio marinus]